MQKLFVAAALMLALLFVDLKAMAQPDSAAADKKEFVHTVYFWLRNPADQTERSQFEKSLIRFINSSKYISSKHIGVPAATNRPVIDSSYTYCLSLTFKSKAEQDQYQDEDVHKVFIRESEQLWQKVLVYDSVSIL